MFLSTNKANRNQRSCDSENNVLLSEVDKIPNNFVLHCIWYIILVLFIFVAMQLFSICIVDNSLAMPGLIGAALIMLLAELIGFFVDRSKPLLKYILVFLSVLAVTIVGIFLTYHTILTCVVPLLIAAQYPQKRVVYYAFVLSIISTFLIVVFGYIYGLSDANMVIQTISKSSVYGKYLSAEIRSFSDVWLSLILFFAVPRSLTLAAFVPILNAIVKNRKMIIMRDVEIKYHGEHDQMTGLYNRAKYAEMLKKDYIALEKVAILYFDVNNLKLVNDQFGHDKGDELIRQAADSIRVVGQEDADAYRLGGDEFMVVLPNGDSKEAEAFIEKWRQNLKTMNSVPRAVKCDVACGYACGSGKVFSEILKIADRNMYENKAHIKGFP